MRSHLLRAAAGNAASGSASGHVTDNLYLHYDFNDSSTATAGSTAVNDLTSNSIDAASVSGNGLDTTTYSFNAWRFNNNSNANVIKIPIGTGSGEFDNNGVFSTNNSTDYSLNFWVYINSFGSGTSYTTQRWIWGGGTTTHGFIGIGFIPTEHQKLNVQVSTSSTYYNPVQSADLSLNTWYNFTVTYDNSNGFVLYQNGSSIATSSSTYSLGSPYTNDTSKILGALTSSSTGAPRRLDGWLGTFSVYTKTLSASDVTQNWNAFKDRFGYATGLITDGLLCNLDAESYSGSGDLTDSANSNDGTISGATFVSTSPKHFVMDGSNDYIGLGTQLNSSLAPNSEDNDASFSFWINLDSVTSDQTIFSNPKKLSNIPILLYYDISVYAAANNDQTGDIGAGSTNVLSVLMKDASTQYVMTTANNAVSANTWYNIVVVLNPSNDVHKIYLNNVLVAKYNSSVANNLSTITADLNIGAASDSSTMDGKFAQFLAYTKALTDAEIQQNWNTFKARYGY